MKTSIMSHRSLSLAGKSVLAAFVLGFSAYSATAALTLDLRVSSTTIGGVTTNNIGGNNGTVFTSGTQNVTGLGIGDAMTFSIYAYVNGTNAEDDANNNGTTNFQGFQNAFGSILQGASGGVKGAWTVQPVFNSAAAGGVNFLNGLRYGASGNQTGAIADLNADGFNDIGSNGQANTDTSLIFARASSMFTTNSTVAPNAISGDGLTTRWLVGTARLTISSIVSATPTLVSWRNPNLVGFTGTQALWQEDGLNKTVATGGILLNGPGVTITGVIPEPSAFGMVMLGALGLVGFRRLGLRRTA